MMMMSKFVNIKINHITIISPFTSFGNISACSIILRYCREKYEYDGEHSPRGGDKPDVEPW